MISFVGLSAQKKEIVIEGTYQGESLMVKKPACDCKVSVNGELAANDTASLWVFTGEGMKVGQAWSFIFELPLRCRLYVLNASDLQSESRIVFDNVEVIDNKLRFTTSGEINNQPILVEHYRNNKWIVIQRLSGKGLEKSENSYQVDVMHNSGTNRYRLRQKSVKKDFRYSKEVEHTSKKKKVSFETDTQSLKFSSETYYEVFNSSGGLEFKGRGDHFALEGLKRGVYYLNFDNQTEKFIKR